MTERPDELERILTDLAPRIAFPPVPDLAASVHAALAAEPARVRPIRSTPDWRHTRRWLALAAAILLLAVIGTLAIPRARHAVADWLGLPGIHIVIEHGKSNPTVTPRAGAGSPTILFGKPVPVSDLSRVAGFPVRVPSGAPLASPEGA